jgi:glycosyltransferase involved in cell wall biosynthesis
VRPLRLTILVPGALDARTGGTRYDVRLAEALAEAGHDCALVPVDGAFPEPDSIARKALAHAFAALPADRLAVVDGLCLATIADVDPLPRFVALMHHPADRESGLDPATAGRLRDRETRALARAARVVATSGHTAALLARDYAVARDRLAVVPPGVSVTVGPSARRLRPALPLRILVVASVTPRKGYDVLVEALGRLRDAGGMPNFRIDCYGSLDREPALAAGMQKMIDARGLAGLVHLHGEVDETELACAYGSADLFVHTAHYEGYGMAVADALAAGLPVVATAGGAVADLVPHSAGVLVPPGDATALADALAHVAGDTLLRVSLAEGARRAGAALPDWSAAAARFAAECAMVAA